MIPPFIPPRLVAGLLAVLALLIGFKAFKSSLIEQGRAECRADVAAASAKFNTEQRAKEQALQFRSQEATDAYAKQAAAARAAAASTRAELDRLRAVLAASGPGAASSAAQPASGADATPIAIVSECAGAVAQLDEEASTLRSKLIGLQSWVRAVLTKE